MVCMVLGFLIWGVSVLVFREGDEYVLVGWFVYFGVMELFLESFVFWD